MTAGAQVDAHVTEADARPVVPEPPAAGLAIYSIALAMALLIQLMASNGVGIWVAGRALIATFLVALAIAVSMRLLLADRHRGGLAAALMTLAVMGGDLRIAIVAILAIVLLAVERFGLRGRVRIRWRIVSRVMSAITTVVVLAIVIQTVQLGALGVWARSLTSEGPLRAQRPVALPASAKEPDIYLLLLDGYARADALRQVFAYDDGPFLAGLASRGFSVSSHARTPYPLTSQVLASMFHMRLLQDIAGVAPLLNGTASQAPGAVIHQAIEVNPLFDRLRERGYEIDAISSGFEEVTIREADRYLDSGEVNEFEVGLLRKTLGGDLLDAFAPDFVSAQQRSRMTNSFATLADIASHPSDHPRFVFTHIPTPHPPWVYNADGSPRTVVPLEATYADTPLSTGLPVANLKKGYSGAVAQLRAPVLAAIDVIEKGSSQPPIIVVFGDHGSWIDADGGDIRLRFLPLLAARVPGIDRPLPDDEALVNVFPDVLNEAFGDSIPRVDPAPTSMFQGGRDFDFFDVGDPNAAIRTP